MPIRTKDAARAWRANEDRREAEYIAAGAAQAQAAKAAPIATVGMFVDGFAPWEVGKAYKQYDLFYITAWLDSAVRQLHRLHTSRRSARAWKRFTAFARRPMITACIRMCTTWRQAWA